MKQASSLVARAAAADEISLPRLEPSGIEQIFDPNQLLNDSLTEELLRVTPLVRRIVRGNLRGIHLKRATEDVEQQVLLALWQWRGRNPDRKLTAEEMAKTASRAAKRAAHYYYRRENKQQMRNPTDPQVDFERVKINENVAAAKNVSLAGETKTEVRSLGKFLFQSIEKLTPRQRFALLLQKSDLIARLLAARACRVLDVAASLSLNRAEFVAALKQMPLSDEQIGELWTEKTGESLTSKQVREARCKARRNIKQALE